MGARRISRSNRSATPPPKKESGTIRAQGRREHDDDAPALDASSEVQRADDPRIEVQRSPGFYIGVAREERLAAGGRAPPPSRAKSAAEADHVDPGYVVFSEPPRGGSWRPGPSLPVYARYGRYEILGRLARGGMAEILLARERALEDAYRHLVVKRILPQSAEDEEHVKMFLAEGRLLMGLRHPSICHVYDVGQHGRTWFIAMEWAHGEPLITVIRRARNRGLSLPSALASRMIADIASALHHAHDARGSDGSRLGLVHRDVSPHNIMVTYDGSVKLLDFGVAKITTSADHTSAGVVKGKFAYMAPEQCLGRDLDARTDVFALGVCLFEALTGRGLYRRGNDYDTLHAIIQEPVPSVRDIDARVPEALDHIVRRALQKRPGDRFDNAQAMQLALEQYLAEERELVSSALVGRMMRGLFAEEIVRGPTLEPLPSASTDDPAPEIVLEESGPRASHSARIDEPPAAHGAPPAEGGAHAPRIPTLRGPLLPDDDVVVGVDARPPVKSGTGGAFFLALLVLAALVGAAAVVSYRVGVLRIDAPANAPDTVAPAATADEAE